MSEFKQKVIYNVSRIPYGKVASYGQIAALSDNPRAARQVGWILGSLSTEESEIPWWRVINSKGYLSIRGDDLIAKQKQRELLESEGITVSQGNNLVDNLARFRWTPEDH